jgi:hypothetical protein
MKQRYDFMHGTKNSLKSYNVMPQQFSKKKKLSRYNVMYQMYPKKHNFDHNLLLVLISFITIMKFQNGNIQTLAILKRHGLYICITLQMKCKILFFQKENFVWMLLCVMYEFIFRFWRSANFLKIYVTIVWIPLKFVTNCAQKLNNLIYG